MGRRRVRGKGADPSEFIAYPRALKLLADRLGATPHEIAAWIFIGPEDGGLAGYVHVHEFKEPQRFGFLPTEHDDYLSQLAGVWFRADDIEAFTKPPRFITYPDLLKRWSVVPGIQPEAFILAKIAESGPVEEGAGLPESRLRHLHPICGGTQAMAPGVSGAHGLPGVEEGLFYLPDVENIEAIDFGESSMSLRELRESLVRTAREKAEELPHDNPLRHAFAGIPDLSADELCRSVNDGKIVAMQIARDPMGAIDIDRAKVAASEVKRVEQWVREVIADAHERHQARTQALEHYANSDEGKRYWQLLMKKNDVERQIREVEMMPAPLPSERESKQRQLVELREEQAKIQRQLDEVDQSNEPAGRAQGDADEKRANTPPSATAAEINLRFVVFPDGQKNGKWWSSMMRNASDNGLKECRVGEGQKGRGGGSLWRPDLIAGWLVDRQKKGLEGGMMTQDARKALKKFPGYSDIADHLFPSET